MRLKNFNFTLTAGCQKTPCSQNQKASQNQLGDVIASFDK